MKLDRMLRGVAVACLGVMACGMPACVSTPEAKSARFLEKGKAFLQKKDNPRAILQFRSALQADPKNAEALYQLGLAYLATAEYPKAFTSLRRALEINPQHKTARLRLAQLLATSNDPAILKEAREKLESLLRETPDDPEALHALALTDLQVGEPATAIEHLQRALAAAPQELVLSTTLAELKLRQNDSAGAEAVLKEACAKSPKSAEARVILGNFYATRGRSADAEQQFQQALAIDSASEAALLNLARLQYGTNRKPEAEQIFKRLSGAEYKNSRHMYALFLFQEGRRDEALRELERLSKADPEDRAARTRLVAAYQAMNRSADASALLDRVLKKNPKDLDSLLQRAELALNARNFSQAELDLNAVLKFKPDSAEVHYALASLRQAQGQRLQARQELSETIRINPFLLRPRIELAKMLLSENSASAALATLDAAPSAQKTNPAFVEQRNWTLIAAGQLSEVRTAIQQARAAGRTAGTLLPDAVLKLADKRYAEARQSLHEALRANPAELQAMRFLVGSYAAQGNVKAGVDEIREHAKRYPQIADVQYFLGNLLLETGDQEGAKAAFLSAKTANPNYAPADLALARVDLLRANWSDARQQLTTILNTKGENPVARLWLGMLEESVGNHADALEAFRKAAEEQPDNPIALNNFAYLLAEQANKPDEALKYAEKAQELAPDNPDIEDTLGWVLYRKGLYENAITHLKSAVAKGAGVRHQYHLSMAYYQAGKQDQARTLLQSALRRDSSPPEARMAMQLMQAGPEATKP